MQRTPPTPRGARANPALAQRAQSLRAFNRLYTRRIGVIGERVLDSPYSLAETRVLWELAHAADAPDAPSAPARAAPRGTAGTAGAGVTASTLAQTLGLDAGYLSRLLASLRRRGLVLASADREDRRRQHLRLSAAGRRAFAPLERRSQQQMSALLAPLSEAQQRELLAATERVGALLADTGPAQSRKAPAAAAAAEARDAPAAPLRLRPPVPGDMGWVVSRHGAIYAQEYGWDWRFEALVARIAADFIDRFEPKREACWIAERGTAGAAERLGCVFLVQARDETTGAVEPGTAQLRMLLVEAATRGQGLGKRLVDECERFARAHGYRRIRLWTNSVLLAARGIYEAAGYRLVAKEKHRSFGKQLVGETWELEL
ncbi:MAG: MarR family transcriptional regulator [Burkholderiales bacterium]|nr:MarR family transcriptional regulator [Burkholderiales bacterium]